MVLGTAQFGMDYGIVNINGKPKKKEVFDILDLAWEKGIRQFDTAPGYCKKLQSVFGGVDIFKIPKFCNSIDHAYHLYSLQIDFNRLAVKKQKFFKKMNEAGINLQVHYIPIHLQPYYQKNYKFKQGEFPMSEVFYSQEVSIPIYPDLHYDELQFVVTEIKESIKYD